MGIVQHRDGSTHLEAVSFSRGHPGLGIGFGFESKPCCLESKPLHLSESLLPCVREEKNPIKTRAVISSGGVKSNAISCANVFCKLETHKLSFSPSEFVGNTGPERLLCLGGSNCFLVCPQAPGITVAPQPSHPNPCFCLRS